MATVTGYTAERMKQIEDETVVDGHVDGSGHLILETRSETVPDIDAGSVIGPVGPQGPAQAPSVDAGNDITAGSDSKNFFDHDNKYTHHVTNFATTAARDAAIPTPTQGMLVRVAGQVQMYDTVFNKWVPLLHGGIEFLGNMIANQNIGADGTNTKVNFNDIQINIGSKWNAATQSWVAPHDGQIEIAATATLFMSGGNATQTTIGIFVNTAEYRIGQTQATVASVSHSGVKWLPIIAGQSVSLQCLVTAAGVTKQIYGSSMTSMGIRYIG